MHPDWIELLDSFTSNEVAFLVVGGVATAVHAEPRYTEDLDLWLRRTEENVAKLQTSLRALGYPTRKTDLQSFWRKDRQKITLGHEPNSIDLFNFQTKALFDEAWARRVEVHMTNMPVSIIGLRDLVQVKRAVANDLDRFDLRLIENMYGNGFPAS